MSKTDCNIIKDLLPSYIDDLCSEESRTIIEEHLQECTECRNFIEQMKGFQLVQDEGNNHKEIDYLKKIKNNNFKKNIFMGLYLAVILVFGIVIWIQSMVHSTVPFIVYGCLAWAMVSIFLLIFSDILDMKLPKTSSKLYYWFTGITGVLFIYEVILMLTCNNWNTFGEILNLDMEKIQGMIQIQLCVIAVIQLLMYILTIVISAKQSKYMILPSTLAPIGMCYSLMMIGLLRDFNTPDIVQKNMLLHTNLMLVICVILLILLHIAKLKEHLKKIISGILIIITLSGAVVSGIIWVNTIETDNQKILEEAMQFYYQETTSQSSSLSIPNNKAANLPACLSLDPVSHEFTFSFDMLSSYLSYGTYEIIDDRLIATTNDGKYNYNFTIKDDKTLLFNKNESSSVKLIDSRLGEQIRDGCKFTKEMVGIQ